MTRREQLEKALFHAWGDFYEAQRNYNGNFGEDDSELHEAEYIVRRLERELNNE